MEGITLKDFIELALIGGGMVASYVKLQGKVDNGHAALAAKIDSQGQLIYSKLDDTRNEVADVKEQVTRQNGRVGKLEQEMAATRVRLAIQREAHQ